MVCALQKYPGGEDAAEATAELLDVIEQLKKYWNPWDKGAPCAPLRAVWHAVEWHHSADWGEDRVLEALERYQQAKRPSARFKRFRRR